MSHIKSYSPGQPIMSSAGGKPASVGKKGNVSTQGKEKHECAEKGGTVENAVRFLAVLVWFLITIPAIYLLLPLRPLHYLLRKCGVPNGSLPLDQICKWQVSPSSVAHIIIITKEWIYFWTRTPSFYIEPLAISVVPLPVFFDSPRSFPDPLLRI